MAAYFLSAEGASFLGGSGGMPPQKNLKFRCLEMLFSTFSRQYLGLKNNQNEDYINHTILCLFTTVLLLKILITGF